MAFYQQAAEQGHQLAIKRLIDAYREGALGLDADPEKQQFWQDRQAGV